ncbi:hypothetical protein JW977_04035 [Candidatus Falkowbacteria bacterium]|nr:hypothetical protein [Candidatus Falkowbacteria bacterium]
MKKRLRKLNFLKSFINKLRPIFCLVLIFILTLSLFGNRPINIKKVDAALLNYTEDFTTATLKDTSNTTGRWNTVATNATLLGHTWTNFAQNREGNENITNTSGRSGVSVRVPLDVDSLGNPHVLWMEASSEVMYSKFSPNAGPGVCGAGINGCWTNATGTRKCCAGITCTNTCSSNADCLTGTCRGFDFISGNTSTSLGGRLAINSSDIPYAIWYDNLTGNNDIYFSKFSPSVGPSICGTGENDCWTNMAGNKICHAGANNGTICTADTDCTGGGICRGYDNISNNTGDSGMSNHIYLDIDSNNLPYVVWADNTPGVWDLFFSKWTIGAGPGICGVGINDCWTNMAGTIAGAENISNTGGVKSDTYRIRLDSSNNPYIIWNQGNNTIWFTKWTSGIGWTKIDNLTLGKDNVSGGWAPVYISELDINNDIAYVTWHGNPTGSGIGLTKGTPGGSWTKMDGTAGNENLEPIAAGQAYFQHVRFDTLGNPYAVWTKDMAGVQIRFTKWTVGAGAGVCGGPADCWTNMAGTVNGPENISTGSNNYYPIFSVDSSNIPYVTWMYPTANEADNSNEIRFTKWTVGAGAGVCGGPADCWTNMEGTVKGYENISNNSGASNVSQIVLDTSSNPFIRWYDFTPGNFDIFMTRYKPDYNLASTVQSLNINTTTDYITSATLNVTDTIAAGQSITYYLSNDGGTIWEAATDGTPHTFTTTGNDLRWKADLTTDNNTTTPIIDDLNISYSTKKIFCSLSPTNQNVGGAITVDASVSFTPVAGSVTAEFEQDNVNYATVALSSVGGDDYSGQIITDINHLGQNDVVVLATDSADGQIYTCNPSVGDVWVKKSLDDISWEPRRGSAALSFNGKLWIIGGTGNTFDWFANDIWSSSDGLNWTENTSPAPWQERGYHGAVVFDNKMWVMGGEANTGASFYMLNDVWSSSDGINWTQVTASAPWSARGDFSLVAYNNEMWVIGGCTALTGGACSGTSNDVWHSPDGVNWTLATAGAAWSTRSTFSSLTYDDGGGEKMWVIGGIGFPGPTIYNDVWSSIDGVTWIAEPAFTARYGMVGVTYDDGSGEKIWIFGGKDTTTTYNNDIWNFDGTTWNLISNPADYPVAGSLPSKWTNPSVKGLSGGVVFNDGSGNKIWVIGGDIEGTLRLNDVWSYGTTWSLKGLNYGSPYGFRWDTPMIGFDADGAGVTPPKLYVIGGFSKLPAAVPSDVWSTTDGVNWICEAGPYTNAVHGVDCANPAPAWSGRWGHKTVIYNNKIWFFGGCSATASGGGAFTGNCPLVNRKNDVWYSADGVNWTQATAGAAWSHRYEPAVTVYDDKMWLTGGYDPALGQIRRDVWYSTDGITWSLAIAVAAWPARIGHSLVTYNDGSGEKMYLMGGWSGAAYLNDVWSSTDGITWTWETMSAAWMGRVTQGALSYDGQMFIFGGQSSPDFLNDVYSSIDGTNWSQVTSEANWSERDFFSYAQFNDRLWVGAGDYSVTYNDVWASAYDFLHFNTASGSGVPIGGGEPSSPSDFYCEAISPDTIRWHFTDTATNETGFKLYGPDGLILDTGDYITTDLAYFDETMLETNTQYSQRYATAFNGAGESGPSNTASCYTLATVPAPPGIREVTSSYIHLLPQVFTNNPPHTEYAFKETSTDKYIDANGLFADIETWQTYDGWGGADGIIVSGDAPLEQYIEQEQYINQVNMSLQPLTHYYFVAKARNGDGIETAFSGATPILTPTTTGLANFSISKGVALNIAKNSASNLFKTAFAEENNPTDSRYILLLREFSMLLNLILIILGIFFIISIFSSVKYLAQSKKSRKSLSLVWNILTKDPAYVFSTHASRDESGTYQSSFQKHRQFQISSQKNLMRAVGIILLKAIIFAVIVLGLAGVNHNSRAQGYDGNGITVKVGDTLSYIINFQNTSSTVLGINVAVYDTLDSHLEYVANSGRLKIGLNPETSEGIGYNNGTLYFNIPIFNPNEFGQATFRAVVKAGSEGAIISNQGFVSGTNFNAAASNIVTNPVGPSIIGPRYECNAANGVCLINPSGPYDNLIDCQAACAVPVPSRYSCNSSTGVCSLSASGNYASFSDCQSVCRIPIINENINLPPPPPPPPPVTPPTPPVIPPVVPPIIEPFISIPIVGPVLEMIFTPEAENAATNYITPTLLTIAAINTIPVAILLTSYLLPYLHLIFVEPFLFFFRRKRKKWGIVYNALSKVPVDLAVVRLYKKSDNSLVQTRVTDRDGRYIFIIKETGKYYISVTKGGFTFPTRYLADEKQDSKYIDLYHGEAIEVTEREATITANIPLDPLEKKVLPEREVIFGYLFKNLRVVVSYVGLVLSVLIFLVYPNWITGVSILLHIILFAIFIRLIVPKKPKSWGIIYDQKTKQPLHYAVVRIFDLKFNKLLETQVTDSKGRYSFLVSKNEYQLLAEKTGYQKKEVKPLDLVEKEEIVNLDLGLEKAKG